MNDVAEFLGTQLNGESKNTFEMKLILDTKFQHLAVLINLKMSRLGSNRGQYP